MTLGQYSTGGAVVIRHYTGINISRKKRFFYSGDHALQNSKKFKLKSTRTKNKSINCYVVLELFWIFFFVNSYIESFWFMFIVLRISWILLNHTKIVRIFFSKFLVSLTCFQMEMSNFTLYNNERPTCCCATIFALVLCYFRLIFKLGSIKIRHCIIKSDAIKLAVDFIV